MCFRSAAVVLLKRSETQPIPKCQWTVIGTRRRAALYGVTAPERHARLLSSRPTTGVAWSQRFMDFSGMKSNYVPRPTRVLFVDDERMVLRALRRVVLSRHPDWDVLCARGADAALRLLDEYSPVDVIVTDLTMPDVDGIALLGIVRERYPGVARVVHSAHVEAFGKRVVSGLCHEILGKPAGATELVGALELASGSSQRAVIAG